MSARFAPVRAARLGVTPFLKGLEPERYTGAEAADGIKEIAKLERLLAGARIRLAKRIDESVAGAEGEDGPGRWLANQTGQNPKDAAKDIDTSKTLDDLDATDEALANGDLSPTQAHEVSSAAAADPSAEQGLLDTAKNASVPELKRKAKKVRAAATNNEDKARRAHENRELSSGVDEDTAEGWIHAKGPAARIAEILALLEPWIQVEFTKARREGRYERRGAYAFDALLAALRFAAACRTGTRGAGPDGTGRAAGGGPNGGPAPVGPPANVLVRADLSAILRGETIAGETCEIDGLGPVPVDALLEILPQAAIDLILTDGVDVFNVTHFGRRANARQQVVLDWLGGQCTRLGCSATRHLQVDHRIDWAKIKITELRNLDWLCVDDHRRKTHDGWALVHGRGRRRMVPPDDPSHPKQSNAPPGGQSAEAA